MTCFDAEMLISPTFYHSVMNTQIGLINVKSNMHCVSMKVWMFVEDFSFGLVLQIST